VSSSARVRRIRSRAPRGSRLSGGGRRRRRAEANLSSASRFRARAVEHLRVGIGALLGGGARGEASPLADRRVGVERAASVPGEVADDAARLSGSSTRQAVNQRCRLEQLGEPSRPAAAVDRARGAEGGTCSRGRPISIGPRRGGRTANRGGRRAVAPGSASASSRIRPSSVALGRSLTAEELNAHAASGHAAACVQDVSRDHARIFPVSDTC
jgi:hypothetical protein